MENYASAYQMYQDLWQYYEEHDYMGIQHRRSARYEIVLAFVKEKYPEQADVMRELPVSYTHLDVYKRQLFDCVSQSVTKVQKHALAGVELIVLNNDSLDIYTAIDNFGQIFLQIFK